MKISYEQTIQGMRMQIAQLMREETKNICLFGKTVEKWK